MDGKSLPHFMRIGGKQVGAEPVCCQGFSLADHRVAPSPTVKSDGTAPDVWRQCSSN
jgi:hypothetical protein